MVDHNSQSPRHRLTQFYTARSMLKTEILLFLGEVLNKPAAQLIEVGAAPLSVIASRPCTR